MSGVRGGCLCGAIRYETTVPPLATLLCHCSNCRKQSGSAFSFNILMPIEAYSQTGETKVFLDSGDSGKHVARNFCADCGSPIYSHSEMIPQYVIIKAGTLDNPETLAPTREVYCDSALPWAIPIPGAKRVAKG